MEIIFILMAPARPENVGAAARALKTMGFSRLRIVASEAHLRQEAVWVAHGAQELLQQAESFPTLPEALADLDLWWSRRRLVSGGVTSLSDPGGNLRPDPQQAGVAAGWHPVWLRRVWAL